MVRMSSSDFLLTTGLLASATSRLYICEQEVGAARVR